MTIILVTTREIKIYPDKEGGEIRTISMYMRRYASKVDEFQFVDLLKHFWNTFARVFSSFYYYFSRSNETTKQLFHLVDKIFNVSLSPFCENATIPKTNVEIPDRTQVQTVRTKVRD